MSEPTAGRWTTEPPTVPGWYWWRQEHGDSAQCVLVTESMGGLRCWRVGEDGSFCMDDGEWYTIPNREPPR